MQQQFTTLREKIAHDTQARAARNQGKMKYIAKATRRNILGKSDYAHVFKRADGVVMLFDTPEAAVAYANASCNEPSYALYNPSYIELKDYIAEGGRK